MNPLSRRNSLSRRNFVTGTTAAAGLLAGCAPAAPHAQQAAEHRPPSDERLTGDRLIVLGTGGGPVFHSGRTGIGSALVVNDQLYVVDCGYGTSRQLALALGGGPDDKADFSGLRAVFLTHLHSDHVADYFPMLSYGLYHGVGEHPVHVRGPGRRGPMQPAVAQRTTGEPEPPVADPDNPVPGTADMTRQLFDAFALDINDRIRDNGKPDLTRVVQAHDIELPDVPGYEPNTSSAPPMDPFPIWSDANVRVSAILVMHWPVAPAFAFRFDTPKGSVVFSGDTGPSDNLVRIARGCDVLVHEVIDPDYIERSTAGKPNGAAMRKHHATAHTSVDDVGGIAQEAGAKTLVLSHIVPGNASDEVLSRAQHGFSGELVIPADRQQIALPDR